MLAVSGCTEKPPPPPTVTPNPPTKEELHHEAALEWYARHQISTEQVSALPELERARLINFLTYQFCDAGLDQPADLNDFYKECATFCGGVSYVYKGLAEVVGLPTRYVHFYNIPNQGNHTAVEVNLGNYWGFFDPTFGAYFSEDGSLSARPLSLVDVANMTSEDQLADKTLQIEKPLPLTTTLSGEEMYGGTFDHEYMRVANYINPEMTSRDNPDEMLVLKIELAADGNEIGDYAAQTLEDLRQGWLLHTNNTLRDQDPVNDTSYAAAFVSNSPHPSATLLQVTGVSNSNPFELGIRVNNTGSVDAEIQIVGVGKATRLLSDPTPELPPGLSELRIKFASAEDDADFLIRALGMQPHMEMLAFIVNQ